MEQSTKAKNSTLRTKNKYRFVHTGNAIGIENCLKINILMNGDSKSQKYCQFLTASHCTTCPSQVNISIIDVVFCRSICAPLGTSLSGSVNVR